VIVNHTEKNRTWAEARADCRGRKADLVIIDNDEEQVNMSLAEEK